MKIFIRFFPLLYIWSVSCNSNAHSNQYSQESDTVIAIQFNSFDTTFTTIHIFVALCDNTYQGIVPVPPKIGNGQDPYNNLYWGCAFGIRTYFSKSNEWKLMSVQKSDSIVLERIVLKHKYKKLYLIADAYDGRYIKQCTINFLQSSCGFDKDILIIQNDTVGIAGNARLIAYIGHDGLMDFQIPQTFINTDSIMRDVLILACYSKHFFSPHLQYANVNPLVWTTGLMAPEAYIIHDALMGYAINETNQQIRKRAALAYSKFQKCSENAALNLLVTGW